MVDLRDETEMQPASYPDAPAGLSAAASAIDPEVIWSRIEDYVRVRWATREVAWILEGEGDWKPPLEPVTAMSVEVWDADAWTSTEPPESALGGFCFSGSGTYRVSATVGDGNVPAKANEAYRRLAEYMAEPMGTAGASSLTHSIGGELSRTVQRNPAWMARAMQNSGAADLLRPYRRLK